jgi:FkbM family methyltransferase
LNEVINFKGVLSAVRPNSTDTNIATAIIGRDAIDSDEYNIRRLAKAGEVFLDVGAYAGHASLLAAQLGMVCVAIEPLPENIEILRHNIALNNAGNAITVIEGALGCNKIFWFSRNDDWGFRRRFVAEPRPLENCSEVAVARVDLDNLMSGYERIHLLKTDCEGGEWFLAKAKRTLAKTKYIVGEFHQRDERTFDDFRKEFEGFEDVSAEFCYQHQEPLRLFAFVNKGIQ